MAFSTPIKISICDKQNIITRQYAVYLQRNTVNSIAIRVVEQKNFIWNSPINTGKKMANRNNTYQVKRPKSQPVLIFHWPAFDSAKQIVCCPAFALSGQLSGKSRNTGQQYIAVIEPHAQQSNRQMTQKNRFEWLNVYRVHNSNHNFVWNFFLLSFWYRWRWWWWLWLCKMNEKPGN